MFPYPAPAALLALLAMLVVSGCATTLPGDDAPRDVDVLPAALAEPFCYPGAAVDATIELVETKRHFRFYEGRFDSGLPDDPDPAPITFEWYQPVGVGKAPVALVLPILNGRKHIVRPFATYFAKHGYAAIIVDSRQRTTLEADILEPQAAILQAVRRHRRVLDWAESEPSLDAGRVVVFGASLGGFNAFFLSALDERVKAVVPALAAADLPYVFANSTENRIAEAFTNVREELDISGEALESRMRERLDTDTAALAPYLDPDRVLMVVAKRDKAVPVAKQLELRELLGTPEAIQLPTGHVTAAAYVLYLRRRILEFFDTTLEQPGVSVVTLSPDSCLAAGRASIIGE